MPAVSSWSMHKDALSAVNACMYTYDDQPLVIERLSSSRMQVDVMRKHVHFELMYNGYITYVPSEFRLSCIRCPIS
jgi:hypothetical protein